MSITKRFFQPQGPFTLGQILQNLEQAGFGHYHLCSDAKEPLQLSLDDVAAVGEARAGRACVAYANNEKYLKIAIATKNTALIITRASIKQNLQIDDSAHNLLLVDEPDYIFALVFRQFYPQARAFQEGIADSAVVAEGVQLGRDVCIATGAYIGAGARLGDRVQIGTNSVIGEDCEIGDDTYIGTLCSLRYARVGRNCHIHAGAVIGERGFGFVSGGEGSGGNLSWPHIGGVCIGDDVEIGANCTIDRGKLVDTVIADGVKIDNLSQIAHNVELGSDVLIVAQAGIAGSARVGRGTIIGGQVGVAEGVSIGEKSRILARSCVHANVAAGSRICGCPAIDADHYMRSWIKFRRAGRKQKDGQFCDE